MGRKQMKKERLDEVRNSCELSETRGNSSINIQRIDAGRLTERAPEIKAKPCVGEDHDEDQSVSCRWRGLSLAYIEYLHYHIVNANLRLIHAVLYTSSLGARLPGGRSEGWRDQTWMFEA